MDLRHLLDQHALDSTFPLPRDAPFTHSTALAAGLSPWKLDQLTAAGLLRRPIKRVYVAAAVPDSLALRIASLRLVVPDDCVLVDRHAGWLLGAQMVLAPGEHLHLRPVSLFRPAGHGRLRNGLAASGERRLSAEDVMEIDGLRVTSPIRTAWDLGRVRRAEDAISGLDSLFRLGSFTREEFLSGIERFRGDRWVSTLRAIGPLADGRSESPGESVLRLRCHENNFASMRPQVEVRSSGLLIARLDLADEDLMAAVEYDGAEWHTSPEQMVHDRGRRTAVRRRRWMVEAFTVVDVFGHFRTVDERLVKLRMEARRRHGLPAF